MAESGLSDFKIKKDDLKDPIITGNGEKDIEQTEKWISPDTESVDSNVSQKEQWDRGCDFILSLLGYSIGLGNVLRFPYVCMRNGGGAFLIPFAICLVLVVMPLLFLEMSVGQFLGKSNLRVWKMFPLFKGLGIGMMIINGIFSIYHNMQMTWTIYYLVNAFQSTLPWSVCSQSWNTDACFVKGQTSNSSHHGNETSITNATVPGNDLTSSINVTVIRRSAVEEFWQYNVLQLSSGLGDFGTIPWHLPVCLLVAWCIIFLCIMKGIKLIGKIVYVTVLLPYLLLTILLIRGLTLDGAMDGLEYYLKPDLNKLLSLQIWTEAGLQVFLSLGTAWGPVITMASFNKFNNNCLRDCVVIALVGEGTSFFCGFIVFSSLGFLANLLDVPIKEVIGSGPGLGFVAYPEALLHLPLPQLWTVIFFSALFFIAIDTQFACVETVITVLMDLFPRLHKIRVLFTLFVCMGGFAFGLPMCTQGGIYIFQLLDWYSSILAVPIYGLIECVLIGWVYGVARYDRDMEIMLGRHVPMFMRISWCFVSPVFLICLFMFTLMTYVPPEYGSYKYPDEAQVFGWIIAVIPLLAVVIPAAHQLISYKDLSILQRLTKSLTVSSAWKPSSSKYRQPYTYEQYTYPDSAFSTRLKSNLFGK